MYYDPDGIPIAGRHVYAASGMSPWSSDLEDGMFNYPFANARHEGGPRNGVLTAVEDFITESPFPLCLFKLPINNGLGIIYTANSRAERFIAENLLPPPALHLLLETSEIARLNDIIRRLRVEKQHPQHSGKGFRSKVLSVLRRLGRL
jgi:hypothetical protein